MSARLLTQVLFWGEAIKFSLRTLRNPSIKINNRTNRITTNMTKAFATIKHDALHFRAEIAFGFVVRAFKRADDVLVWGF